RPSRAGHKTIPPPRVQRVPGGVVRQRCGQAPPERYQRGFSVPFWEAMSTKIDQKWIILGHLVDRAADMLDIYLIREVLRSCGGQLRLILDAPTAAAFSGGHRWRQRHHRLRIRFRTAAHPETAPEPARQRRRLDRPEPRHHP